MSNYTSNNYINDLKYQYTSKLKPSTSNSDLKKYPQEKLLNSKLYCLNSSASKFICVGLSLDDLCPKIQFGNQKGYNIIISEEEWRNLLKNQGVIANYFYSTYGDHFPLNIGDVVIYFEKINECPVIKFKKCNGDYIYFSRETIEKLWEIQELIDYRIIILKKQDFEKYFNVFQTSLMNNSMDLLTNVYNVLSPSQNLNSENVSTMLEILVMYPSVLETKLRRSAPKRKYYEEIGEF